MHRPILAVVVATAALLCAAPQAGAQAAPAACAPSDLGCALTAGVTNLATALGATTTTTAPSTTTTTVRALPARGLAGVSASSAGAVTAAAGTADALATVAPPAVNPAELVLPPLAIPDFGPAPTVVSAAPVAVPRARVDRAAAPRSARPGTDPGSSAAVALGACLVAAVLLVAGSLGLRRLPAHQLISPRFLRLRTSAEPRRLRVISPGR